MAENRVEIIVTSKNETREGFASAKRDAEKAGDEAGQGFTSKFGSWLSKGLTGAGGGLSNLPFVGGAIPEAAGSNPYVAGGVLAVVTAGAAALVTEAVALASGFAAATAGVGAFALVARPAFANLQQDAKNLTTAWDAVQAAQNKFALDPNKTTAKALQTAQLNLKAIQMTLGQDAGPAALQVLKLRDAYNALTNSLQPQVFQVLGNALKIVTSLLPDLKPFASAAAGAIDGLLIKVQKFVQSADFRKWLDQFVKLVGPSITAIGTGIGKVIIAVGKLFTLMSAHDVVHAINIAFDVIVGAINGVVFAVHVLMVVWDRGWHDIKFATLNAIGTILDALAKAFGWIPGGVGKSLKDAAHQFDLFRLHVEGQMTETAGSVQGLIGTIGGIGPAIQAAAQAVSSSLGSAGSALQGTGGTGGTAGHPHINIAVGGGGSGSGLDHLFMQWLKQTIRVQGGGGKNSVQIALGQTH